MSHSAATPQAQEYVDKAIATPGSLERQSANVVLRAHGKPAIGTLLSTDALTPEVKLFLVKHFEVRMSA